MRITVTLDPDVYRLLKDEAHRRGESFKVVLNEAVRQAFRTKPQVKIGVGLSSSKRALWDFVPASIQPDSANWPMKWKSTRF